ncbi:MAG: sigma-70 family RNA polymerase sigma factor [Planctomycetota bacterium]
MNEREREQRFDQWLADHSGLLFKVVRAFATAIQDREDLFQHIAVQLWNSLKTYDGSVAPTTWIYRVAFYAANSWSRKEFRRRRKTNLLGEGDAELIQETEPQDARLRDVMEQIRRLEEVDRSIALMLLDGCSYQDIAEVLGISMNNVGVRIHRIKKKLTRNLNPQPERAHEV